jgi:uncharacterized membrane protein YgcG
MFDFLGTMKGPEFLGLFIFWFFLMWGSLLFLRYRGFDTPVVTVGCLLIFEGLGVARIWIGSEAELHHWTILIVMMFIGPWFFVIRLEQLQEFARNSRNNNNSCSAGGGCSSSGSSGGSGSGSGCGGGGSCGGGGCGGCGGS